MEKLVKRPRLDRVNLETINEALQHYIHSLEDRLVAHDNDKTRFEKPKEWLRKREKTNWLLTNAKHTEVRIAQNLKGVESGRTPEPLKHLLKINANENPNDYIKFFEALSFLPKSGNLEKDIKRLLNAVESGVINSYRHQYEDGSSLVKLRKLDVFRYAEYLRTHK